MTATVVMTSAALIKKNRSNVLDSMRVSTWNIPKNREEAPRCGLLWVMNLPKFQLVTGTQRNRRSDSDNEQLESGETNSPGRTWK